MSTTLLLIRHAQSAPDRALPDEEWPLSEAGRAQAAVLADVLPQFGVTGVVSSPYIRAVDTVRPFAEQHHLPIAIEPDLRERLLTREWFASEAELFAALRRMHADLSFAYPDGESGHACRTRFMTALSSIAAVNDGGCVAIATHGAVISHLLSRLDETLPFEFWHRIRNPHLFHLEWRGDLRWVGETTLNGDAGVKAW
jgi:2,3-bisphosphoglycerate-dependent phosphoglycerate mutase